MRLLVEMRALVEESIAVDARHMNRRHATWEEVAALLGVSRQAASKRYGGPEPVRKSTTPTPAPRRS